MTEAASTVSPHSPDSAAPHRNSQLLSWGGADWSSAELNCYPLTQSQPPPSVPPTSRLSRIIQFASSIFDGVCQGAAHHPAMQYRTIVANALHTLGQYQTQSENAAGTSIDDLLSSLMDPGQDWAFLRDLGFSLTET